MPLLAPPPSKEKPVAIFGREPTAFTAMLGTLIDLIGGYALHLSGMQTSALNAVVAAVVGLVVVLTVRPFPIAAVTSVTGAAIGVAVAFSVNVPDNFGPALNAAIVAVVTFWLRGQVSPAPALQRGRR